MGSKSGFKTPPPSITAFIEPRDYLVELVTWAHTEGNSNLELCGSTALEFLERRVYGNPVETAVRRRAWKQWTRIILRTLGSTNQAHLDFNLYMRFCGLVAAKYPSVAIRGAPWSDEEACFLEIAYSMEWAANTWEALRLRRLYQGGLHDELSNALDDTAFAWRSYTETLMGACIGRVPRFYISSSLIESFWLTDVNIPSEDVRLPFEECVLLFPDDSVHVKLMGELKAVVVCEAKYHDNEPAIALFSGYEAPTFPMPGYMPRDAELVSEIVHSVIESTNDRHKAIIGGISGDNIESHKQQAKLFSLVANFALYTTNMQDDVQLDCQDEINRMAARAKRHQDGSRKRRKLERAIERKQKGAIYIVGSKFESRLGDSGGDVSMRARHVVRGHWRNQPYGPGREFRRQVFIKPHYRGGIPKVNEGAPEPPPKDYYVSK